ncbi:flavin-containing monooxygenase [Parvularcula dongshanensis]
MRGTYAGDRDAPLAGRAGVGQARAMSEHFDVLIIGAGLSGIGAAYHVQDKLPGLTYAILEGRERMGGTWDLFRYPGVRSDSDMYTLGYPFRPWMGDEAITSGASILAYIEETAKAYGIDEKIRYETRVRRVSWSSGDALWTVEADTPGGPVTLTCRYLLSCCGYYDYEGGYTPDFPGAEDFGGEIVHPQDWHDGVETEGKRIVVIGSGATAVTLVPALTQTAAHVTMLQRTPTYVASRPAKDELSAIARRFLPGPLAHGVLRAKNVLMSIYIYQLSRKKPQKLRRYLIDEAQKRLGDEVQADPHFAPPYDPWDQRLCLVPDDDLFEALRGGSASIVTDQIERFDEAGILLESGQHLDADLVVSATGLKLLPFGGIEIVLDGAPLDLASTYNYKGMMFSGVPNFAACFGYTNASWTLKIDLTARAFCRLIRAAMRRGADSFVPRFDGEPPAPQPLLDFASGYVQRDIHRFPRQGPQRPWRNHQNYVADALDIGLGRIDDGVMRFERARKTEESAA